MNELAFEWNQQTAQLNLRKHGVSFKQASTVFYDKNARLIYDSDHSLDEERYLLFVKQLNKKVNNTVNFSYERRIRFL